MRLFCWFCHKSVSSELHEDAVFRAIAICPECIQKDLIIFPDDAKSGDVESRRVVS